MIDGRTVPAGLAKQRLWSTRWGSIELQSKIQATSRCQLATFIASCLNSLHFWYQKWRGMISMMLMLVWYNHQETHIRKKCLNLSRPSFFRKNAVVHFRGFCLGSGLSFQQLGNPGDVEGWRFCWMTLFEKYLQFEIKQMMLEILILQETRLVMLNVCSQFQPPLCHDWSLNPEWYVALLGNWRSLLDDTDKLLLETYQLYPKHLSTNFKMEESDRYNNSSLMFTVRSTNKTSLQRGLSLTTPISGQGAEEMLAVAAEAHDIYEEPDWNVKRGQVSKLYFNKTIRVVFVCSYS